jgi:2-polyprenyl-6-methoxyphenol hydroxylase-like FAD-dependent oxidoreductase
MKIAVAGAGPAGLLFALLTRRRHPTFDIEVFEQNAADATFGFGVVFSRGALEFLSRDEPEMHAELSRMMESWPIQRIVHRDEVIDIDGNGFSAIGRLQLLQLLQERCRGAGVRMTFGKALDPEALPHADLIVAADGVNSAIRRRFAGHFQPRIQLLTNKFAWYGTRKPFECLTLTFRDSPHGAFVAHHYRYSPQMSTFIVECEAATWHRAGLDRMSDEESRRYCEQVFAGDLGGQPLIGNKSVWRNFPLLCNERWTHENIVLIGDALRTGHFSIGSGTRLAFDDAIALSRALEGNTSVEEALTEFERQRRPVVEKIVTAANLSSYWYERLDDKMALEPWRLAYDYMTRSGRMTDERLRDEAPRWMRLVDARRAAAPLAAHPERIADPVSDGAPGATEIGFTLPVRYNASSILFSNLDRSRADKVALLCGDRKLTYAQLCETASRGRGKSRGKGSGLAI